MSIALRRGLGLETILLAPIAGLDGQGAPTYAAAVNLKARVARTDTVVRLRNGDEIKAFATVWVDGRSSTLPNADDKITLEDGMVGIVVERKAPRGLRTDTIDHVQVKLRRA